MSLMRATSAVFSPVSGAATTTLTLSSPHEHHAVGVALGRHQTLDLGLGHRVRRQHLQGPGCLVENTLLGVFVALRLLQHMDGVVPCLLAAEPCRGEIIVLRRGRIPCRLLIGVDQLRLAQHLVVLDAVAVPPVHVHRTAHQQQYRRRHTSPFPHRFHVRPSCYCSHCTTVIFSVDSPVSAATASVTARRTALLPAP